MGFTRFNCAALAAATVLGVAASSQAALILDLQGGATVVADNGPGDSDLTIGRIINTSVTAGFGVSVTVAQSNSPGDPSAGILQVQSLDIQNMNPNPATLVLRVSDTGFTMPGGPLMRLDSSVGGTFTLGAVGDLVTFQSFADPANGQPAGPVSTPAMLFTRATNNVTESFSGANSANWARGGGPYSLTNITTVMLSAGGQMNVSGTTTAVEVPEPQLLSALGLGVFGLLRRGRK
jgi:hypothetical protein